LVNLSPVGKSAVKSAPSAVAAGFQILPHQCLYLVRTQPVQGPHLVDAGMVASRHLDNLAKCREVKELVFHMLGGVFAGSQVKLHVRLGLFTQNKKSAFMRAGMALGSFVTVERPLEWKFDFAAIRPYLKFGPKFVFSLCGRLHAARSGSGSSKNTRSAKAQPTTGRKNATQFRFAANDPPRTCRAVSASDQHGHARTLANQQTVLAGSERSLLSADRAGHNLRRGVVRSHRAPGVQTPQPSAGRGGRAALQSNYRG
jgi:hypothetical protein